MKSIVSGKKWLLILVIGIFSVLFVLTFIIRSFLFRNRSVLKFSVDDATEILLEIASNDYDSIFESDRMFLFKQMHEKYDLDVTLFLYEKLGNFSLSDFSDKYKNEFSDNSDWLKLGWHGIDDGNPQESCYVEDDLIQSYNNTRKEIIRFAGNCSLSKELRIHFWYTDGSFVIKQLSNDGIDGLYYCDTDVLGYDFSQEEDSRIRKDADGVLCKWYGFNKISFQLTDIRLDNIQNDDELIGLLQNRNKDKDIVIFTHAWMMYNSSKYIETMCEWAADNNYAMDWN